MNCYPALSWQREKTDRAMKTIGNASEKWRKPYYCWSEAGTLCAVKYLEGAKEVLISCQDRDNCFRHKELIRLAKIEYLLQHFKSAMEYAAKSDEFSVKSGGKRFAEGFFWKPISAYSMGDTAAARRMADEMDRQSPNSSGLEKLRAALAKSS